MIEHSASIFTTVKNIYKLYKQSFLFVLPLLIINGAIDCFLIFKPEYESCQNFTNGFIFYSIIFMVYHIHHSKISHYKDLPKINVIRFITMQLAYLIIFLPFLIVGIPLLIKIMENTELHLQTVLSSSSSFFVESLVAIAILNFIIFIYGLLTPVMIVGQNQGIFKSIKDSFRLVNGNWWKTCGLLLLFLAFVLLPAIVLDLILRNYTSNAFVVVYEMFLSFTTPVMPCLLVIYHDNLTNTLKV